MPASKIATVKLLTLDLMLRYSFAIGNRPRLVEVEGRVRISAGYVRNVL